MALRIEGAPDGLALSVVSISTTSVQLVAARKSRRLLFLQQISGANNLYVGTDSSVTTSTGIQLTSLPNPLPTAAELWVIASTGFTGVVGVLELFDVED